MTEVRAVTIDPGELALDERAVAKARLVEAGGRELVLGVVTPEDEVFQRQAVVDVAERNVCEIGTSKVDPLTFRIPYPLFDLLG
jgi:hypothetical protein